jgi:hypothetical protein
MSIQRIKSGVIADSAVTSEKFASSLTLPANVAVTNGIAFPATQSASSNANTLDDYEEGTWTPTIKQVNSTTVSVTINYARYTKIGRIVHCVLAFTRNDAGALTDAITFDLPFASQPSGSSSFISSGTFWGDNSGGPAVGSGIVILDNYADNIGNFAVGYNNATFTYLNFGSTANTINNGGRVLSSFTYEAA